MPELVVLLDKQIIKRIAIKGTSVTLGRHPKCDVALPDRTISLHHARITMVRDDCFLEDLDSTNGTYVNRLSVEQHYLEDGDSIDLGKYRVVFRSEQKVDSQLQRLSIHPKLMEPTFPAWLKVLDGRKSGYIIPLIQERVVLGNQQTRQILIERSTLGEYIIREAGKEAARTSRKLIPGEELRVEDVLFQFCLKNPDANNHTSP
ncbi:MAG: FHA domain-containing protein [Thiothrix sp.]|uniref:FHA domain-containing protein n=1 Tax=Thiothrix sp. TaxID=1032 RepID=UPI00262518B3|nr:FHA domain-containing protein [Thiothrix sp.]MDD5394096.1 FHA domain-containing protein [Thiothrix sp.]